MIELSRLNGRKFILNCDLIKTIESAPDTIITLTTGEKLMVLEPVSQVISQTVAFRQLLSRGPLTSAAVSPGPDSHPEPRRSS